MTIVIPLPPGHCKPGTQWHHSAAFNFHEEIAGHCIAVSNRYGWTMAQSDAGCVNLAEMAKQDITPTGINAFAGLDSAIRGGTGRPQAAREILGQIAESCSGPIVASQAPDQRSSKGVPEPQQTAEKPPLRGSRVEAGKPVPAFCSDPAVANPYLLAECPR